MSLTSSSGVRLRPASDTGSGNGSYLPQLPLLVMLEDRPQQLPFHVNRARSDTFSDALLLVAADQLDIDILQLKLGT